MSAARFSILHDALLRLEWAPDGRFVDEPSILASVSTDFPGIYKRPRARQILIVRDDQPGTHTLETRFLKLEYTPTAVSPSATVPSAARTCTDGASLPNTFHPDTLRVVIKRGQENPHPLPEGGGRGWVWFDSRAEPTSKGATTSTFAVWRPGDRDTRNLGGALESLDGLKGAPTSGVIAHGLLSRSGWHLVDDAQSALRVGDWVTSRAALGYADRAAPSPAPYDGRARVDSYLFAYADDYQAAFDALWDLSTPPVHPPRAMLGSWFSRYWPYTSNDFRELVDDYERHGFPLDILVMDMDWHTGAARPGGGRWTGWSWNRDLLPDAERLIYDLHARGIQVTLNLHPSLGVYPDEERYGAFMRALGRDPARGEVVAFDAGDRAYMHALFKEVIAPLERVSAGGCIETPSQREGEGGGLTSKPAVEKSLTDVGSGGLAPPRRGVDFWWLDWQQERYVRSIPPPGLTNLQWLNELFFRHSRGRLLPQANESTSHPADGAPPTRRGRSFSRWAGLGDHRHPMHFSGDAHSGWEMLAFQVAFTLASANSGCFFWSHDIGGHYGWRDEEAMTRWTQFGAFSAALRLHSARHAELDRRPWLCKEPFAGAMRRAFALRARLMPTISSQVAFAIRRGTSFLRPMYHDLPECERAYASPTQYFLGNALLVAPIVEAATDKAMRECADDCGHPCVVTREVWFPPFAAHMSISARRHGPDLRFPVEWVRLDTGERFQVPNSAAARGDGVVALVSAAVDEVPVFCRAGAPVFMQPSGPRMAGPIRIPTRVRERFGKVEPDQSQDTQTLIVRLFPPSGDMGARSDLREDDGESLRGMIEQVHTVAMTEWAIDHATGTAHLRLSISGAQGSFEGQRQCRRWIIELGGVSDLQVESITATGVALDPEFLAKWEAARHDSEIDPIESMRLGDEPIAPNGPNAPAHSESGQHGILRRIALTPMDIRAPLNVTLSMTLIDQRGYDASVRAARARRMLRSAPLNTPSQREREGGGRAGESPSGHPTRSVDGSTTDADRALHAAIDATNAESLAFAEQYARVLRVASGIGVCVRTPGPCAEPQSGAAETVLVVPTDLGIESRGVRVETVDTCGPVERTVDARQIDPDDCGNATLSHVGLVLDEPPIGRVARRVVRIRIRDRAGRDLEFAQEVVRSARQIRAWRIAGPFGWDWRRSIREQRAWPEEQVSADEVHGTQPEVGLGPAWRDAEPGPTWACDLGAMFRDPGSDSPGKGLAYARALLLSPRAQRCRVRAACADKLEVWVNGKRVFSQDDFAGAEARAGGFDCELREGVNRVLVKCPDGWGDWGFSLWAECPWALSEESWPAGDSAAAAHPMAG